MLSVRVGRLQSAAREITPTQQVEHDDPETFSPACLSADVRRNGRKVHVQATYASEFPREPEEGSEALAQGASIERRRRARAIREISSHPARRSHAARRPAGAG